jgi:HEPN domain-containing protein
VRARDEVAYRLALAEGFLAEAEQDMELERWRSCVNNAQLVVENAGKAVLAWFGAVPKTHDPAQQIAALLRTQTLPEEIQETIRR